jgi:hypothetical protein
VVFWIVLSTIIYFNPGYISLLLLLVRVDGAAGAPTPRRLRRRRRHDDIFRTRDYLFASVRLLADLALMQPVHSFHKTIAKYGYY